MCIRIPLPYRFPPTPENSPSNEPVAAEKSKPFPRAPPSPAHQTPPSLRRPVHRTSSKSSTPVSQRWSGPKTTHWVEESCALSTRMLIVVRPKCLATLAESWRLALKTWTSNPADRHQSRTCLLTCLSSESIDDSCLILCKSTTTGTVFLGAPVSYAAGPCWVTDPCPNSSLEKEWRLPSFPSTWFVPSLSLSAEIVLCLDASLPMRWSPSKERCLAVRWSSEWFLRNRCSGSAEICRRNATCAVADYQSWPDRRGWQWDLIKR